jgi:Flp pilus assembly protein TadB
MSPTAFIVIGILLGLVVAALSLAGAVIVAIPVAIIGIGMMAALDLNRRREQAKQVHDFREDAKTDKVDFSERDQQTLVSE